MKKENWIIPLLALIAALLFYNLAFMLAEHQVFKEYKSYCSYLTQQN